MTKTSRLLRLPEVIRITGLGRDSIYRLGNLGCFPMRVKVSERASAWRENEVLRWIETRPAAKPIRRPRGQSNRPAA